MKSQTLTAFWRLAAHIPALREIIGQRDALAQACRELTEQRGALAGERDELKQHLDRLSSEIRGLLAQVEAGEKVIEVLRAQRDELAKDRDESLGHASRLSGELDAANARETELQVQRSHLLDQRDTLEKERDGLKLHTDKLTHEFHGLKDQCEALELKIAAWRRLWVKPGHFYSPVANPDEERVSKAAAGRRDRTLGPGEDLTLEESSMLELLHAIGAYYPDLPFTPSRIPPYRYYFENPMFSYADAITLFGILRLCRPKRLIEVGCGFSSCAVMDINDLFFNGAMDASFFDPFPEALLSLLDPDDRYRAMVNQVALQDIPTAAFTRLEENDCLFIDSSHVAKTASDVLDYLFRVLPVLNRGVILHIHDVCYPFEYPEEWILTENRSWNEAYFLRAFLQYNQSFKVIYWNDLVYNKHRALTAGLMPLCLKNTGGSIWLRKV